MHEIVQLLSLIMKAYKKAVEERYRFYSFGDAMFITDISNK